MSKKYKKATERIKKFKIHKYHTMERNVQHVIPHDDKWAVRAENSEQVTKTFDSKRAAIGYAYDLASKDDAHIAVHSPTGEIDRFKSTKDTNKLIQMLLK